MALVFSHSRNETAAHKVGCSEAETPRAGAAEQTPSSSATAGLRCGIFGASTLSESNGAR